ncbi:MAG: hypothetical protein ACRC9T_03025 [Vibrionaceae bacterium]
MPPDNALTAIAGPTPATAIRQMRALTHSVLEICNLMLNELQLLQGNVPPI